MPRSLANPFCPAGPGVRPAQVLQSSSAAPDTTFARPGPAQYSHNNTSAEHDCESSLLLESHGSCPHGFGIYGGTDHANVFRSPSVGPQSSSYCPSSAHQPARRELLGWLGLVAAGLTIETQVPVLTPAWSQDPIAGTRATDDPRDDFSPWGVASGAEWLSDFPRFNPFLKTAGIRWLRASYEWGSIQPTRGQFNWAETDRLLANARANGIHLTCIFHYLASWASADGGTRKFPIKNIQFWRDYVGALVARYHQEIKYWEVWNEFNGSFAENGNPALYAELVKEASLTAKAIDPTAKIGVSVANFDVNFLDAAIKAGAGGHFDYICVHPYEKLDALSNNGEVEFLAMRQTLQQMLATNGLPLEMPFWITEIGAQAPGRPEPEADSRQAIALAKAYLLSLAAGFQRVFWFEARGPSYGNQTDFGLIRNDFTLRPSYQALRTLTEALGPEPARIGWLKLGTTGYGFCFSGGGQPVLAAWAPSGQPIPVQFDADVMILDLAGTRRRLPAGQTFALTHVPQLVLNPPLTLAQAAAANLDRLSLWGADYGKADLVAARLREINAEDGLRQIHPDTTIPVTLGNEPCRRTNFAKAGAEGHYVYFSAAPQFVASRTGELEITAVVRRLEPTALAGMSLDYESKNGYVNGGYLSIPESADWQELKWKIADANFVGQWGWHFRLNAIASPNEFLVKEVRLRKFL
jgi:hypothetical protein